MRLSLRTLDDLVATDLIAMTDASDDPSWERLLAAIEDGYLLEQAERSGDLQQTSRDLEKGLLTMAAARRDWPRVLTFAVMALNLRTLAGILDDDGVLLPLVELRPQLALTFIDQIPAPGRRARARALLVHHGRGVELGPHQEALLADLEDAAPVAGDAVAAGRWAAVLADIAALLGADLRAVWKPWLRKLEEFPALERKVRYSLVRALLAAEDWHSESLAWCLARIDPVTDADLDPRVLLPMPLPSGLMDEPWPFLDRLFTAMPAARGLAWRCALTLLAARTGRRSCRRAPEAWRWIEERGGPLPWDAKTVSCSARLWSRLDEPCLERLKRTLPAGESRAALCVAVLAGRTDADAAEAAAAAVDELDDAGSWLRWELRRAHLLEGRLDEREHRRLALVLTTLRRQRMEAAPDDLARALDLVAEHRPLRLRHWLQRTVHAPTTDAACLLALADHARSERLLEELHRRAERWATCVGESAAAGFTLRAELLTLVTTRLCARRSDLSDLRATLPRLLGGERERLCEAVANRLADAGRHGRAREVLEMIEDGPEKLRIEMAVLPPRDDRGLTLSQLYDRGAQACRVREEIEALAAFTAHREAPFGALSPTRQLVVSLDTVRRRLVEQEVVAHATRHDRVDALLHGKTGGIDDPAQLVALTGELAAVGSKPGPATAVEEHLQAIRLVLDSRRVEESLRRDALVDLLCSCEARFESAGSGFHAWRGRRALRRFLERAVRLPEEQPDGRDNRRLHARWHLVLPFLVALGERNARRRPLRWLRHLPPKPDGKGVVDLCRATPAERCRLARRWCEGGVPEGADAEALAWLMVSSQPQLACDLAAASEEPVARSEILLRLVHSGWLDAASVERAAVAVAPAFAARMRLARLPLHGRPTGGESWYPSLAAVVARGDWPNAGTRREAMRRALWEADPERTLPFLAQAMVIAFRRDDASAAAEAIRLFVNAWIRPRWDGDRDPAVEDRVREARRSLLRASRLAATTARGALRPPAEQGIEDLAL